MKFSVTFKDPDGPRECLDDEAKRLVASIEGLDEDERECVFSARREKLDDFTGQWLKYGEYVTIDFDTDAGTATVRKNS